MSAADNLLSRLQRVKRTGPGKWSASCPTREDKSPSLSVRELDDGTVLLYDHGGDSVEAILGAVGLSFTDLYSTQPGHFAKPTRRPFNASDVLSLMVFESSVIVGIACRVSKGMDEDDPDRSRLLEAAKRLGNAGEVCNGPR